MPDQGNQVQDKEPDFHQMALDAIRDEGQYDPRNPFYQRVLIRPRIHWLRVVLLLIGLVISTGSAVFFVNVMRLPVWLKMVCVFGVFFMFVFLHAKMILMDLITIYQHFAPDAIRNKCRFEPSCSQYMLLSIQKYGIIGGTQKGIKRLKRCAPPNGGFDEP